VKVPHLIYHTAWAFSFSNKPYFSSLEITSLICSGLEISYIRHLLRMKENAPHTKYVKIAPSAIFELWKNDEKKKKYINYSFP
jgi:hypothetical protein